MEISTLAAVAGCGAGFCILVLLVIAVKTAMTPDQTQTIDMAQNPTDYTRNERANQKETTMIFEGENAFDTPNARIWADARRRADEMTGYNAGYWSVNARVAREEELRQSVAELRRIAESMGFEITPDNPTETGRATWLNSPPVQRPMENDAESDRMQETMDRGQIENTWSFRLFSPPDATPDPEYDIEIDDPDASGLERLE